MHRVARQNPASAALLVMTDAAYFALSLACVAAVLVSQVHRGAPGRPGRHDVPRPPGAHGTRRRGHRHLGTVLCKQKKRFPMRVTSGLSLLTTPIYVRRWLHQARVKYPRVLGAPKTEARLMVFELWARCPSAATT